MPRIRIIACCASLLAFAALSAAGASWAQGKAGVPANAHPKSYGKGWECNQGYRETREGCTAVDVPANAFPTLAAYGKGWECKYGFRALEEGCVRIEIPANAYLDGRGDRWRC